MATPTRECPHPDVHTYPDGSTGCTVCGQDLSQPDPSFDPAEVSRWLAETTTLPLPQLSADTPEMLQARLAEIAQPRKYDRDTIRAQVLVILTEAQRHPLPTGYATRLIMELFDELATSASVPTIPARPGSSAQGSRSGHDGQGLDATADDRPSSYPVVDTDAERVSDA